MRLSFFGAAGTVTGSRFLIEHQRARLLVDCGLFQGQRAIRERNWHPFPVDPASIDAVLVTHAHIDHSGYVPALIKQGFRGDVYCTPATADLCSILWPDSGHLQEEEAAYRNRHGATRHKPARPLYTAAEGEKALEWLAVKPMGETFEPVPGLTASFTHVGHILGSAYARVSDGAQTVTFSGDVGRPDDVLMRPPEPLAPTDYLVLESTYGDRRHPDTDPAAELARLIRETADNDGTVVIPAFAVGRAQAILYLLDTAIREGAIPELPVYLDSPMAINATDLLCQYDDEQRLDEAGCRQVCERAICTRSVAESKSINRRRGPKIVLSASGMANGGRILHHLRHYLPDGRNTVVFVGYQAAGTLGARLVGGERTARIFGQDLAVAARIEYLDGLSAHADYQEMIDWLSGLATPPRQTFLVHGEPEARQALAEHISQQLGWPVATPELDTEVELAERREAVSHGD